MVKLEEAIKSTTFYSQKQKAGLNIMYNAWWLKNLVSQELKQFALTHEQFNVLRILSGKHPEQMCVRDIGSRMIEPNSNVPRIVDRLVVKKLVKRNTSSVDRRETVMTLTGAGMNILALATQRINTVMEEAIAISETEAGQLNMVLDKLRAE